MVVRLRTDGNSKCQIVTRKRLFLMIVALMSSVGQFWIAPKEAKSFLLKAVETNGNFSATVASIDRNETAVSSSSSLSNLFSATTTRRNMTGTWVGNIWYPPAPWRYYSPIEIRKLLGKTSIHFFGASTAYRALYTLIGQMVRDEITGIDSSNMTREDQEELMIALQEFHGNEPERLNASFPRLTSPDSDCTHLCHYSNKKACRFCKYVSKVTNNNVKTDAIFTHSLSYCIGRDLLPLFRQELIDTKKYLQGPDNVPMPFLLRYIDVFVISIGTWDEGKKMDCLHGMKGYQLNNYTEGLLQYVDLTLQVLNEYQKVSNKTIIWRTTGFFAHKFGRSDSPMIRALNNHVMDVLDGYQNPGLTYVNYGGAIEPRSFHPNRIVGDHIAHYGFEARIVLTQMLVNHLLDLGVISKE